MNRPYDDERYEADDVTFYPIKDGELVLSLDGADTAKGSSYLFALDVDIPGSYSVTLSAKSDLSATAQIPVTMFTTGFPSAVFTFNGTNGEWSEISHPVNIFSRFLVCRLYFGGGGLTLKEMRIKLVSQMQPGEP